MKRTEFERKSPAWSIRNSAGAVASNCLWWSSFVDTICKVMGVIRLIGVVAIRITFILPIDTHSFAARCSTYIHFCYLKSHVGVGGWLDGSVLMYNVRCGG